MADNSNPFTIIYDEPQEAQWFRSLHQDLTGAPVKSINAVRSEPGLSRVLLYDRPDIILLRNGDPVLVLEETVEVPSGHNVGQRFARLAASSECGVPNIYFGPYKARKHGGITEGPRFVNARLFYALDEMVKATGTASTTIDWPVDEKCEVRKDAAKDSDVREYLAFFVQAIDRSVNLRDLNQAILQSEVHQRMTAERTQFVKDSIKRPERYDSPPTSVHIMAHKDFEAAHGLNTEPQDKGKGDIVRYKIGMTKIRSDPFAGMAMLYRYLYALPGSRSLALWLPFISKSTWEQTPDKRKDKRLLSLAADLIVFSDGWAKT